MKTRIRASLGRATIAFAMLASVTSAPASSSALLRFNGDNFFVAVSTRNNDLLGVDSNDPLTLEAWIYLYDISGANLIFTKVAATAPNATTLGYDLGRGSTPVLQFGIRDAGTTLSARGNNVWTDATLPETLEVRRWYHLAFSFDGTTVTFYVDGQEVGADAFSYDGGGTTVAGAYIGGNSSATDFDGYAREVRIWDHARSQTEIQNNLLVAAPGDAPGLIAAWPLDEGEGGLVYNRVEGANDGEIINAHYSWAGDARNWRDFTLADIETGSTDFTRSNEVEVAYLPKPPGYTHYQISEHDDAGLLGDAWIALDAVQERVVFTPPGADATVTLHAWLTNTTASVPLIRTSADIIHTAVPPQPAVRATLVGETAGFTVRIEPEDLDAGSTGGMYADRAIGVWRRRVLCLNPASCDATPDAAYVTLSETPGVYELYLEVVNAAGNAATSATPVQVTVQVAAAPPADGDRFVAVGNLHAEPPYATWTTAAESIQTAVNAVTDDGELIRVWAGIYRAPTNAVFGSGATNIVNIVRPVTLRAVGPADKSRIDGEGANRGLRIAYDQAEPPFVLDGFTVVNGLAPDGGAVFYANNANQSHFLNCRFIDNIAAGNRTSSGGAIRATTAVIEIGNCLFRRNRVIAPGSGGAILQTTASLIISDSGFEDNTANHTTHQDGGGIFITGGTLTVGNTWFVDNRSSTGGNAGTYGGTLRYAGANVHVALRNCLIVGGFSRDGGAIGGVGANNQRLDIENCTITDNYRAIYSRGGNGDVNLINSIVYGNNIDFRSPGSAWNYNFYHNCTPFFSLVTDYAENNNFAIDPQFVDPDVGDYRLKRTSPCINSGIFQEWMTGATDLDGRPRINAISGVVDIGAYEFHHPGTILMIR